MVMDLKEHRWMRIDDDYYYDGYYYRRIVWFVLVSICMMSVIIWKCADGASRKQAASSDSSDQYHGANCAAGCGAACGA
ncbi:hypothetical protein ACP275_09G064200 [Erythranthe tilingii]